MNEIKVGDLVHVFRGMPCCGLQTGAEGMIFKVVSMKNLAGDICFGCGAILPDICADGCPNRLPINLSRLRRIPPLSELESLKTEHKEREPA